MNMHLRMGSILLFGLLTLVGCKEEIANNLPTDETQEPKVISEEGDGGNGGSGTGSGGGNGKICYGVRELSKIVFAIGKDISQKGFNHALDFDKNGVNDKNDYVVIKEAYCGSTCFTEKDYAKMKEAYGSAVGDCDYTTDWDFNANGKIDGDDAEITKKNMCNSDRKSLAASSL